MMPLEPIAVDEIELARLIGMSVDFLRKDRVTRRLLPYYKIGKTVRYDVTRVRQALILMEEGGGLRKKTRTSMRAGLLSQLEVENAALKITLKQFQGEK